MHLSQRPSGTLRRSTKYCEILDPPSFNGGCHCKTTALDVISAMHTFCGWPTSARTTTGLEGSDGPLMPESFWARTRNWYSRPSIKLWQVASLDLIDDLLFSFCQSRPCSHIARKSVVSSPAASANSIAAYAADLAGRPRAPKARALWA